MYDDFLATILEPDTFLPSQFYGNGGLARALEGEKRLMIAIMKTKHLQYWYLLEALSNSLLKGFIVGEAARYWAEKTEKERKEAEEESVDCR